MNRVFIDMDGVIVDFERYRENLGLTGDQVKVLPGAYFEMPPMSGALDAVKSISEMGFEVFIATKPPTGVAGAYADKAAWVFKYLPGYERHFILTPDKGLLGDAGDVLIDDRIHKANCLQFKGTLIHFTEENGWEQVLEILRKLKEDREPHKVYIGRVKPISDIFAQF